MLTGVIPDCSTHFSSMADEDDHYECLGLENADVDILSKNNRDYIFCYKCTGSPPPYGDLPRYPPSSQPSFMGDSTFSTWVSCAYDEVIHWRRHLFSVPVGRACTQFVHKLACLFQSFADGLALEGVAFEGCNAVANFTSPKAHFKSRSREDARILERHQSCWQVGDLDSLLQKCCLIQQHFPSSAVSTGLSSGQMACCFAKLMMKKKFSVASHLIRDNVESYSLALNSRVFAADAKSSVRDVLLRKHLAGHPPKPSVLVSLSTTLSAPPFHPVLFDRSDGSLIHHMILQMDSVARLSGVDVASWRKLCASFQSAFDSLCDALAAVARRLVTTFVDSVCLSAFTACYLIALDKCPGVRPIVIGEVCRQLISKAVLVIVRDDVLQAAGPLQLCAGQPAGVRLSFTPCGWYFILQILRVFFRRIIPILLTASIGKLLYEIYSFSVLTLHKF